MIFEGGPRREKAFLYIDSKYFTEDLLAEANRFVHCRPGFKIKWGTLAERLEARKAYYYECPIRPQLERDDLTQEKRHALAARADSQDELFRKLEDIPGFHLRLGQLKRGRKGAPPTQKMVDVQLAVDMLNHAHSGACGYFYLLAGDADFVPVVESLTTMGHWVNVIAFPHSASKDLLRAADQHVFLRGRELISWGIVDHPRVNDWRNMGGSASWHPLKQIDWQQLWGEASKKIHFKFLENGSPHWQVQLSYEQGQAHGQSGGFWPAIYASIREMDPGTAWPLAPNETARAQWEELDPTVMARET